VGKLESVFSKLQGSATNVEWNRTAT